MDKILNISKKSVLDSFFDYAAGYYESGLKLIDSLLDNNRYSELSNLSEAFRKENICLEEESHIYPILFLFRQYVELIIKSLYIFFDMENDKQFYDNKIDLFSNHKISEIWPGLMKRLLIEEKENENVEGISEILDNIIKKIIKLDDNSFCYRYPVDRNQNPYLKQDQQYNLNEIKSDMLEFDNLIHEYL